MSKIVVGVDGSPGSRAALRWAHDEARLRAADLVVVNVWQYPMMTSLPAFGAMPPPDDLGTEAQAALLKTLSDEGVDATGDLPVTTVVAEGAPAAALLEAAADADLLVVGSRGHGGFTGLLLGSVSQQCASHAVCPVVVVRTD
jgi:nucleotide-binding universal stress UspA family protein